MDIPLISIPTWISLIFYLVMLALTQTNYYEPFMNIRWVALGVLTASALSDWILVGGRGGHKDRGTNGQVLTIYLLATFGTVIYAENWMFSGMRWASHAAMLLVSMVFLPQIMVPSQTQRVLSIIKYTMTILLVFSWLRPAIEKIPDSGDLYHGAMGNANTMGHIAFITALVYLRSALTSKVTLHRILSSAMVMAAAGTVWQSGARSSIIALSIGVLMLFHYYRRETQRYVILAILLGSLLMVAFPNLPGEISRFIIKSNGNRENTLLNPMRTRLPVWRAAYNGFKQRPWLGWGFGASSNVTKQSEFSLTAARIVQRDAVNDVMFMLEGCGVVGVGAYILLLYIIFKQRPSKFQKSILQSSDRIQNINPAAASLYNTHVLLYALSVCLILLNQFDNSALSAGNLISVTLWLSVGCAATLRHELGEFQ